MSITIVCGLQWGDEGKGKIVDLLASEADIVVRYQGGNNAGHTVVHGDSVFKLNTLPVGILSRKRSIIGNGVVLNPWSLLDEIDIVRKQGVEVNPENLQISDACPIVLPLHSALDAAREDAAGLQKIGTTRRGIGPAYEDKVGRRALRTADLLEPEALSEYISTLLRHHNASEQSRTFQLPSHDELLNALNIVALRLAGYIRPVWRELAEAYREGKDILYEGAHGLFLDIDHGTYPYATSSNTTPAMAACGSGLGEAARGTVVGVIKAYSTRVGGGPFPTELSNNIGDHLAYMGNEIGTVTGRKRRCGWLDIVMLRQAISISGARELAITKIDVLDGLDEIAICTGYRLNGKYIDHLPSQRKSQAVVEPIYEWHAGWQMSTRGLRKVGELPRQARALIDRIAQIATTPISIISTGPGRDDTIRISSFTTSS